MGIYNFPVLRKPEIITINENICYIQQTRNPLSAEVIFIFDPEQNLTWIYDVGSCEFAAECINLIPSPKNIVLSHYHEDHYTNITDVSADQVFAGRHGVKRMGRGTVVEGTMNFGCVTLFEFPSSHAKTCVGLQMGEYAFLGDGVYSDEKMGTQFYNVQKLQALIEFLKKLDVKYLCLSHDRRFIRTKESILLFLEHIYSKRQSSSPYIVINPRKSL